MTATGSFPGRFVEHEMAAESDDDAPLALLDLCRGFLGNLRRNRARSRMG